VHIKAKCVADERRGTHKSTANKSGSIDTAVPLAVALVETPGFLFGEGKGLRNEQSKWLG